MNARWRLAALAAAVLAGAAAFASAEEAPSTRATLEDYLDSLAMPRLAARREAVLAIATQSQAEQRKAGVRARILALIGEPVHGVPLRARVTGGSVGNGFRVENVLYDAQPGRRVTANLFLPAEGEGPFPAVILSPGHGPSGKLSNYGFAANFARNGFVALAYDIVGEGERLEYYDAEAGVSLGGRPTGDHSIAAFPAILAGEHVARYFVEDAMQGVDYLASRPEVDARRIGAFGCSGGGTVTAYLAALDERIAAAAPACFVTDFEHLLPTAGPQEAEQSIHDFVAEGLDFADWVELAAPMPYAVVSTTEDMFPFDGARATVEEARAFWAAYGAAERLEWITGPGGHGALAPLGEAILDFFRRSLAAEGPAVPFEWLRPGRPEQLLVTPSGQLAISVGSVALADLTRERIAAIEPSEAPSAEALREAIVELARVCSQPGGSPDVRPVSVTMEDGLSFATFRLASEKGPLELLRVQAGRPSTRRVLLLLTDEAVTGPAADRARLARYARAGWIVVALRARGFDGEGESKTDWVGDQNLLALRAMLVGRTLAGIRIDDTFAVLDWIERGYGDAPVTLRGAGLAGPVALQAALLDARVDEVVVEGSPVSLRAAAALPIARELPANTVPGMLARYDLPDVIAALAPRRVTFVAPVDGLGRPLAEEAFRKLLPASAHVVFDAGQ